MEHIELVQHVHIHTGQKKNLINSYNLTVTNVYGEEEETNGNLIKLDYILKNAHGTERHYAGHK